MECSLILSKQNYATNYLSIYRFLIVSCNHISRTPSLVSRILCQTDWDADESVAADSNTDPDRRSTKK